MRKILSLFLMTFVSVMMFAATETTVYYTAPEATIGTYSVKLNVNFKGDGDDWHQFDMTKTTLTYNGDPVYSYKYTDAYDGVGVMQFQLFDGETWKSQKVAINSWTGVDTYNGKMYVHATEQWVAAPADGGESGEGAYELTFVYYNKTDGDSSGKLSTVEGVFDEESQAYVDEVTKGSDVYAGRKYKDDITGDSIFSNLKFGSSSKAGQLTFTLKEEVEVDSIVFHAAMYSDTEGGDGFSVNGTAFTLSRGKLKFEEKVWKPTGKVSSIDIVQTKASKGRFFLTAISVYPKQSTGGDDPVVEPEVTLPVVAIAGTMNEWSAEANVMVAAEDSLNASVKIALEAQKYEFKVVSDGQWLSLNGEGETLYGIHREWNEVAHINGVDLRNFELTADVAGEYTFTWTYADSTLVVTFPEKSEEPIVEPEVKLPVVAIAGTMNEWSAEANVMVAAEDSLSASVKIALEAQKYEFKVVSDGQWLSLNGEGETLYGIHREWNEVAHINGVDLRNFELTADVAGEYTFTWTYADSTLVVTFPEKPAEPVVGDGPIFEWTKGAGAAIEADNTDLNANDLGTMTVGKSVVARLLGTNAVENNARGYKLGNNDVCVEIEGTRAFAAGDTVVITGVCGGSGERAFAVAPVSTIDAKADTVLTNYQENTSDVLEYKAVLKEQQAGDKIRIFRLAAKTMYLYSIKVLPYVENEEPIEPQPVEVDSTTLYFVNNLAWEAVNAYVWPAEGDAAYKAWPGEAMTKEAEQINGFDVYSYKFPASYVNIIFNNGNSGEGNQTSNLVWEATKPYFFDGEWYASVEEVAPHCAQVTEGIWTVTETTPLDANSIYVHNNLMKMKPAYAAAWDGFNNPQQFGEYSFTYAMLIRSEAWPTEQIPAGAEYVEGNKNTTSLIVEAKEDIDITIFYRRQTGNQSENDSKDLKIFDHSAITTAIQGVFQIIELDGDYFSATKKLSLVKGHRYTITAKGTTPKIFAIAYGQPAEPDPAKFYVTGDSALIADAAPAGTAAWAPNAIKSENDTLVLNLKADQYYILKVAVNGTWEGENNVKGYNELTEKTEGLEDEGNDHNIRFKLNEAGYVKVIYKAAEGENPEIFKLEGDFYVAPVVAPAKFYVTGDSALIADAAPAGTAVWASNAIKSEKDTLVLNLKAGVDYQLSLTVDGTWNTKKTYANLTQEDKSGLYDVDGENHNIGFKLNEPGEVKVVYFVKDEVVTFELIGNFYVAPVDPQEEVTVYFVNTPRWDGVNIYLWNNETFENNAAWPGLAMTKEETKVQGFDVYSYTFVNSKNFDKCIFNHIDQTADLELHAGQYYCVDTWYESIEAIPELDIDEPSPIDPTTAHFYIKHAGNNWTWVEMTYDAVMDAFTYQSVWAGNGANINTVGEDNGNAWYPAAMINVAEDVELRDTVLFAYNYNTKALSVTLVGKYVQKLANGYYIIGLNGWTVDDLSESDDLFYSTGIETGEFSLETTLTEGAVFKVVRVEGDAIINWYGIQTSEQNPDGNYIVDAAHAGEKTIYFRPEWNEDWAGHIYVEPNETTAISNTAADAEAVKVLHNGMLLIRKGNKTYNIMGQAVK